MYWIFKYYIDKPHASIVKVYLNTHDQYDVETNLDVRKMVLPKHIQ